MRVAEMILGEHTLAASVDLVEDASNRQSGRHQAIRAECSVKHKRRQEGYSASNKQSAATLKASRTATSPAQGACLCHLVMSETTNITTTPAKETIGAAVLFSL
jgi:hypothetical protein